MSAHLKLKPFVKSHKSLHAELILLDALLYRSKNQYRGFPFWRKVQEVKRAAGRVERDICSLIEGFSSKKDLKNDAARPSRRKNSRQLMQAIETVQSAANRAYLALRQIIDLESFMPLVLSLTAIIAKINSIAEELLAHVALSAAVLDQLNSIKMSKTIASIDANKPAVQESKNGTEDPDPEHVVQALPAGTSQQTSHQEETKATPAVNIPSGMIETPDPITESQSVKRKLDAQPPIAKTKQKKRKKDEIDDIFGGL